MNITVLTETLLETIEANREKHIMEYKEQIKGWQIKMEEYNNAMVEWASQGGKGRKPVEPYKPHDYLDTYDDNIKMVSAHIEPKIVLSEHEFNQLINDEFNWKGTFLATSNLYSNERY